MIPADSAPRGGRPVLELLLRRPELAQGEDREGVGPAEGVVELGMPVRASTRSGRRPGGSRRASQLGEQAQGRRAPPECREAPGAPGGGCGPGVVAAVPALEGRIPYALGGRSAAGGPASERIQRMVREGAHRPGGGGVQSRAGSPTRRTRPRGITNASIARRRDRSVYILVFGPVGGCVGERWRGNRRAVLLVVGPPLARRCGVAPGVRRPWRPLRPSRWRRPGPAPVTGSRPSEPRRGVEAKPRRKRTTRRASPR